MWSQLRRLARRRRFLLVLVGLALLTTACAIPPKHTGERPEGPRRNLPFDPEAR